MLRIHRSVPTIVAVLAALVLLAACGANNRNGTPSAIGTGPTTSTNQPSVTGTSTSDSTSTTGSTTTPTSATVSASALTAAYRAETRALATYRNVLATLGAVRPFANIAKSERQHETTIVKLAAAHAVTLPKPATGETSPATLRLACALGVRTEQRVVALYDSYIPKLAGYPDLQRAFENIRTASAEDHLPAFQRCA